MSAVLISDGLEPPIEQEGTIEVAKLSGGQGGDSEGVTHQQIISALGRLEGLVEAEADARRDFRDAFLRRLENVETKTGAICMELAKMTHRLEERPAGAIAAIARLFERQPLLSVVFAGVILALGSGGIISIYEAVTK